MGIEIERKFLLTDARWRDEVRSSCVMRQGYLGAPGGKSSIRVRLEGSQARLNIKAAVLGSARAEYEYPIPPSEAREILDTLCIGRVEKTRHYVQRDGLTWEIDEFSGDNAGLIVAEVELERVDQALVRPPWLGGEITDQARYYNHSLAMQPYCSWSAADAS
jgi:adenylate cyclase